MAYQNFYSSKITNAIGAADTSITVDNAPTATAGRMTLEARNATQREIIKYTGVAGNVLTGVLRGQGGTTAKTHVAASLIQQNATAEDFQDIIDAFNSFSATNTDWRNIVQTLSYVSGGNQGAKFCDLKLAAVDARTFLSQGMKLQYSRPSAPSTQVINLTAASSMYANRVSASLTGGITTLGTTYTVEALVKIKSYPARFGSANIICRRNEPFTGGWGFRITFEGRIEIYGQAVGQTVDLAQSRAKVVQDEWAMLTMSIDHTGAVATAYIDGMPITIDSYTNGSTATVANIGDLAIGRAGQSPGEYADMEIAEVRVWNTIRTATQVKDNYNNSLTGSESGLVGYWKGDGNFTDLTSSANNLTAQNGAVATLVDHPWSTIEYAEVQSVSYSAPDSTIRVYGIVPNQTLSSPKWAAARAPLNCPAYLNQPKRYYDTSGYRVVDYGSFKDYTYRWWQPSSATSPAGRIGQPAISFPAGITEAHRVEPIGCVWAGNYSGHVNASVEPMYTGTTGLSTSVTSIYSGGSLSVEGYVNVTLRDRSS